MKNIKGLWMVIVGVILFCVALITGGIIVLSLLPNSAPITVPQSSSTNTDTNPTPTLSVELEHGSGNPVIIEAPISGSAPLTVAFTGLTVGASSQKLDFGDGQKVETGMNGDWPSKIITHTYATPGTYTATLYRATPSVAMSSVIITVTQ